MNTKQNTNPRIYISELMPTAQLRRYVPECGIELVRFSVGDTLEHPHDALARLKDDFPPETQYILHGPFLDLNAASWDEAIRSATLRRYMQVYALAKELGASKIVLHSGFIPNAHYIEGWIERMAEFFLRFLDQCDGVMIALENCFDPDYAPLFALWRKVGRPNFTLCLDVGHAHCYGASSVNHWARALLPALTHIHIHDNHGWQSRFRNPDEHLALGAGTLPANEVLSILKQKSSLTYTVECADPKSVDDTLITLLTTLGDN
ncbi:MAG: sugar phosphate isomerase/epimerase [Clostridia bacterium]|nr:sugar phosphate isomerase/epimerase [Clostridia bacterium]